MSEVEFLHVQCEFALKLFCEVLREERNLRDDLPIVLFLHFLSEMLRYFIQDLLALQEEVSFALLLVQVLQVLEHLHLQLLRNTPALHVLRYVVFRLPEGGGGEAH